MPKDVEDCISSVLDDNPDMDESTAWAICNSMDNKGQLADFMALFKSEDNETATLAEFRNPSEIRRIEDGNTVTYKRVMLLSPGMWTDAGSESTVDYDSEGIRKSAENFVDLEAIQQQFPRWPQMSNDQRANALQKADESVFADHIPVNLLHGPAMYGSDSLDEIGHISADSIIVDDKGRLYGDIELSRDKAQGETAIELMDEVLEAAQDPNQQAPPVGPSVEIPADRTSHSDGGPMTLEEAWFSAVGIVFNPASRPVELGTQAQERAVAMTAAASNTDNKDSQLRSNSRVTQLKKRARRLLAYQRQTDYMDDDLAASLKTLENALTDIERTLQEFGEIQDIIEQAETEGFDSSEKTVAELVEFVQTEMDIDENTLSELQDAADAFLQTVEAESLNAVSAEAMVDWLDETGADVNENEETEEEDNNGMNMEELQEVKETLGEFAEHMSDIKDMLQAHESQREQTIEDLERRLSEMESEPQQRSLASQPGSTDEEFIDYNDTQEADEPSGPPMM